MKPGVRITIQAVDWCLRIAGVVMVIGLLIAIFDYVRFRDLHPPREVTDIRSFREWRPDLVQARKIEARGSIYYAVQGPFVSVLPSAHSEYYFDANGNYLGRNVDPGDFKEPALFFSSDAEHSGISIDEIPRSGSSSD